MLPDSQDNPASASKSTEPAGAAAASAGNAAPLFCVPRRDFGATGVKVAQLCLGGGSFRHGGGQALLEAALRCGVDNWEIAPFAGAVYHDYFQEYPKRRGNIFLSGKVTATEAPVMQAQLEQTLRDHGTTYLDFLAVHGVADVRVLTDEVRRWAERAKQAGIIRHFGFCTHRNMSHCLHGAARLGWIDGIQTVYNYRLQNNPDLTDAVRRCHDQGIGVFVVKSMGLPVLSAAERRQLPFPEDRLQALLAGEQLTFPQAKLLAIWQNSGVTAICSLMPSLAILHENVAAAMDPLPLSETARQWLARHAADTQSRYCSRCGRCDPANADHIPIFDLMEMLMYLRGYDMADPIKRKFAQIPAAIRGRIANSDYSAAERLCPQEMPIGQLMREAAAELSP